MIPDIVEADQGRKRVVGPQQRAPPADPDDVPHSLECQAGLIFCSAGKVIVITAPPSFRMDMRMVPLL